MDDTTPIDGIQHERFVKWVHYKNNIKKAELIKTVIKQIQYILTKEKTKES